MFRSVCDSPVLSRALRPVTAALVVLLAIAVFASVAHAAPPAPRLAPVAVPTKEAPRGGAITVPFVVTSRVPVQRGVLVWYLSKSKAPRGITAKVGKTSLVKLRRARRLAGRARIAIPRAHRGGSFHLIGCFEGVTTKAGRVPRSCSASPRRLLVGGPAVDPAKLLRKPAPLNVAPTLEAGAASTATIGTAGGTITATDSRGTAFTLVIPAQALPGDTTITMTPVASIGRLPFSGGLVGAVDLKPDGLRLFRAATLRIEPQVMPPLASQAPFLYHGAGKNFHSYPLTADRSKLELSLMHFTGGGVATATGAEKQAQQARVPSEVESQLAQRNAATVDQLRSGKFNQKQFVDQLTASLREYYVKVAAPRLAAATTDDTLGELAIATYFGWRRQVELLGLRGRFETEIEAGQKAIPRILRNAFERSYQRCIAGEIAHTRRMVAIARAAALLGIDLPNIMDRLDRCLRFEMDYELIASMRRADRYNEEADLHVVATRAPLSFSFEEGLVGDLPLTVPVWGHYDPVCYQPKGGVAMVVRNGRATVSIEANLTYKRLPDGRVTYSSDPPLVTATVDPGEVSTKGPAPCVREHDFYKKSLTTLFSDTMNPPSSLYGPVNPLLLQSWTHQGTSPWAVLRVQRQNALGASAFTGELGAKLYHAPAK